MRKLGLFLTLCTALLLYPLSSFALGLGEIEVNSFLNQPLKAEIEVVSARPGEVDDLLVSLASRDAFRKAGLERPAELSRLKFKVEKSEDGTSAKILITTKTPIKEPFLNFLVEADWAKGRLLREFTVLLDPPYFSQPAEPATPQVSGTQTQAAVEQPVATQAESFSPEPIAEQPAAVDETMVEQPIALSEESETEQVTTTYVEESAYQPEMSSNEIVVSKGDTLWGIASQYKDDDHSMAQVMLAMQAMNPDAFRQNNINNLKVGAVLRAPEQYELDRLSRQEAYAQVLEQNGLWDEYVARSSGTTTMGSPEEMQVADQQPAQAEGEGQLSLLTPDEGDSTSASFQNDANAEDAGQIRKQLALAEEDLEAAKLENQDLKSRIADLEEQINKFEELQKLVQIQDDSLAQLQQQEQQAVEAVEEPVATDESMTGMVEEQPTEVMKEAAETIMTEQGDEMMAEEPATEAEMVTDQMASEEGVAEDTAPTEDQTMQPMVEGPDMEGMDEMADSTMQEEPAVVEPEQEEEQQAGPIPAPVIVTEAPVTSGDGGITDMLPSLDSLLADPIMLGGIGAILVLLIAFLFLKRKKASSDEASVMEGIEDLQDEDATPIHMPGSEDVEPETGEIEDALEVAGGDFEQMADTLATEAEEEEDELNKTAVISPDELPSPEDAAASEQDDVLNEVDVYLAYGLYDNAEELLNDSLKNSPDRADYRAKLLDTYFATKNASSFVKEAEALKSLGGAADRYWDRVQIMGFELAPDNELFAGAKDSGMTAADLEYTKPESADFDIGAEEDITDFSNTDFNLSEDSDIFNLTDTQVMPDSNDVDTQVVAPGSDEDLIATRESLDDDLLSLDDEEPTKLREAEVPEQNELPDEIGDFDLDLDEAVEEIDEEMVDEDALSFDLPEDLDLSTEEDLPTSEQGTATDESLIPLDPTVEAPDLTHVPPMEEESDELEMDMDTSEFEEDLSELDDEVSLDFADEDSKSEEAVTTSDAKEVEETMAMSSVERAEQQVDREGTRHIEAALDMDISDLENAELHTGTFKAADDITEFSPAEITGEFTAFDVDAEDAVEEVDASAGLEKTGTYAPGDFDDEIDSVMSDAPEDDIEDLMLPDDVDEVATKLDLAKAFIDMGDAEGARSSLEEVIAEGTTEQKALATGLLEKIN